MASSSSNTNISPVPIPAPYIAPVSHYPHTAPIWSGSVQQFIPNQRIDLRVAE